MPTVADYIAQHRPALVEAFARDAGRLSSAQAATHDELVNGLEAYLVALGDARAEAERELHRLEETHLSLRLRLGYAQDQAVEEYVILGRLVSALWAERPADARPPAHDVQRLFDRLQRAMDHAVALFSGDTAEDRQRERHFVRRLDALSREQEPAHGPLAGRLEPLLAVLQEALHADGSALFMAAQDGRELVLRASVGLGAEAPGSFRTPVAPDAFLGQVALAEEPLQWVDVSGRRDVRPAVRASGVLTLMGVRMWPSGKLLGVVSVGRARVQPFTPRERRLFELLADQLTALVGRAALLERLSEREQGYRLALEATADIIWEWDLSTDALRWSDALERHFGYAPGQVVHAMDWWRSHIHPDEVEGVWRSIEAAVHSGATRWQEEYRFLRGDGTWARVLDRGVIARRADGAPERMVGAMRDVTAEREARAALEESERRLRLVVDTIPFLINFVDTHERYLLTNGAYRTWFGHDPGSLLGRPVREVVGEENYAQVRPMVRRALAGEQVQYEAPFVFGDGRRGHVIITHVPWRDAHGRVQGYVSTVVDITERKALESERLRALEALQRSEQQFRTLAESMPQIVWTARPDGTLDYVNRYFSDVTGHPVEDALEHGWSQLLHPDNRGPAEAAWRHAVESGAPYETELHLRHARGGYTWQLARALPVRGADGRVERWLGTTTDIEGLKRAQVEAERRSDFEQKLIGIVSHDLRNPLNAIVLAGTTLLRRPELDERTRRTMRRVVDAAERMQRMIRDLLDFTQARLGGGLPVERAPLDLHALVRQVVDEALLAHPQRTARVEAEGDGHGRFDGDRIAQLLTNLLDNAFAYGPGGSPVRVTTRGLNGEVLLEVHNEGPPIPGDQLARLFQPLERGAQQRDRSARSIGLGLFIVESIARAHGGRVEVQSSAEAGTVFRVRLPRG